MKPRAATSGLAAALRSARKAAVLLVGSIVLALGIAMIALPGPALLVIPLGLALLATEFRWAARLLAGFREKAGRALRRPA